MHTRVWWLRWPERGEPVEVIACRRHARDLMLGELAAEALATNGAGVCELCTAEAEVLRELQTLPGIPEPVRR